MIILDILVGIAILVALFAVGSLVGMCIHHAARRDTEYLRWLADLSEARKHEAQR
jgi:hypothetical protein